MADAACGPSNALQSFQKHTSADRTLQHDRLTARNGPAQGFRSDRMGVAGALDPEFLDFQAGGGVQQPLDFAGPRAQTPLGHLRPMPSQSGLFGRPPPQQQQQRQQPAWAADFQRLNLSAGPGPQAASRAQPQAKWYEDFQRQHTPPPFQGSQQAAYTSRMNYTPLQGAAYQPFGQAPAYGAPAVLDKGKGRALEAPDQFDDSAFEREFEALETEPAPEVGPVLETGPVDMEQDVPYDEKLWTDENQRFEDQEADVGSETEAQLNAGGGVEDQADQTLFYEPLHQPPAQEVVPQPAEQQEAGARGPSDEDLAAAAGQLLERVSDNTTEKFRQSSFLALMGQLRDREVRVDGDRIVNADQAVRPDGSGAGAADRIAGFDMNMSGALDPRDALHAPAA